MDTNKQDADTLIRAEHHEALKKIKETLENNPDLYQAKLKKHQEIFGKDKETRTKIQWERLVLVYGVDQVAKLEQISVDDVKDHYETLKHRLARKQRNRF
jgi:thiamine pyrophosphate-dependent acetolactate synthase large subunit-like protein